MVALKLGKADGGSARGGGKQERRGGIETRLWGKAAAIWARKQERRGGIETLLNTRN